jgi:hypothetical protein
MRKIIRKVAAVGAGVAMLGSTLGGAVAVSMDDMSGTFGVANTAYVVGSDAGTNDDSARDVLTNYFGGFVETSEGFTYNSDDDEDDDITINGVDNLVGFGEIDSGMIDSLFEGEIEVNDTDYTAREIINFSTATNITTSFKGGQKEFGETPYLAYQANSLKYGYSFSDPVPLYQVSTDETMDLSFLGKSVEIKTISSTENTVTLEVTNTVSVDSGQSTTYKGHTISVVRVYSASATIDVDGEEKIISTGSNKDFGSDVTVELDTVGYSSDDPSLSSVVLKLSEQGVASTVADGNAFELFTDYDTNSHSPWVWDIVGNTTHLLYLGVDNRWTSDDLEPSQDYKTLPVTVGESVVFPNNYAALVFDSLTTETFADFSVIFDESRDLSDEDDSSISVDNRAMAIFDSADGKYFELSGTDYHTIYVVNNATAYAGANQPILQFWGEDDDGYHYTTGASFVLNYNDDDKDIALTNGTTTNLTTSLTITANDWTMSFPWNFSTDYFGSQEGTDQDTDIVVDSTNIGTKEYDVLLQDGTVVLNPDATMGTDKLEFKIPDQDVTATFKVYTIASAGEVEPVLKTEAGAAGYDTLILVGGPCVNTLTADYLELPVNSCEADSGIAADAALVELVEKDGKTALIVAGYEKADTLRAANAVAAGGLTGTSMIV